MQSEMDAECPTPLSWSLRYQHQKLAGLFPAPGMPCPHLEEGKGVKRLLSPSLVVAVQRGGAGGGEYPGEEAASAAPRCMALRWEPKTLVFPELKGKQSHPVPIS